MNAGTSVLVLQTRCPETGEAVTQHELEAYRTRVKIDTPWHGLEKLPIGSRMLLTPRSARHMLAAGSITTMEEPGLIISRESRAEGGNPELGGTDHGSKGTDRGPPPHR
jgi:hypothetical protein